MTIFLILAPYGVFATLLMLASADISLFCAALICLGIIAIDVSRGRTIKTLTLGSAAVFTAIGLYLNFADATLSTTDIKIAVDIGILLVSFGSIVLRRPFTRQYALEMVDAATTQLPGFESVTYSIAWAWTGATLLMLLGNLATLYVPALPLWSGLLVAFAARNIAVLFTRWYPQYRSAKYAANALPSN